MPRILLHWAAWALLFGACTSQDRVQLCTLGGGETYLCPQGTECALTERRCLPVTGTCGNGILDPGEVCDDGNQRAGDGCSPFCTFEVCGNAIVDPGEVCDDGNTVDGDGCAHDCKSIEVCGNGIVNVGEVCDDGNHVDGDGCSRDCRSTEVCGNAIVDVAVGEVCDDGNTRDGDHCSHDCRSTEQCNNRVVDPGEECDHGLFDPINNQSGNRNSNDCRADCVINRCGDGHVDTEPGPHQEACDGAPPAGPGDPVAHPTETTTCNLDCTLARCGDRKVNPAAGEQCDDGNLVDGDGCSHDCRLELSATASSTEGSPAIAR